MHPTDVNFFVLIIVCFTITFILHLQSTMHVLLIKQEKVYLSLFEFQLVTVHNGKKFKGGEYLCKALYIRGRHIGNLMIKCIGIDTVELLISYILKKQY